MQEAFKAHPDNSQYVVYNYRLLKKTSSNADAATSLLENYLEDNYIVQVIQQLYNEYIEQGTEIKQKNYCEKLEMMPYDHSEMSSLAKLYYQQEEYKKALEMVEMRLGNSPYSSAGWEDKGGC